MAEVRNMGDPALAEAAASVMAKVAATLPDDREQYLFHAVSKVYRTDARYPPARDLSLIRRACWREEALAIRYGDEHRVVTERTILPLAIVYSERRLVVLAWCCLREAFRMFRVDRILEARAKGASFRPRRASLLRAFLGELKAQDRMAVTSSASRGDHRQA